MQNKILYMVLGDINEINQSQNCYCKAIVQKPGVVWLNRTFVYCRICVIWDVAKNIKNIDVHCCVGALSNAKMKKKRSHSYFNMI